MDLGLCMIVKDERNIIDDCLSGILDLFEDITVIDTGSTDGTLEWLSDKPGVRVMQARLDPADCYGKAEVLNWGYAQLKTPWILKLDADERVSRTEIQALRERAEDPAIAGYFMPWMTHHGSTVVEDYKLSLFRRGYKWQGLVHDNLQVHLRSLSAWAEWLDSLHIHHYPNGPALATKRPFYRERLSCALRKQPSWHRYRWFLGYSWFMEGDLEQAERHLSIVADAESLVFPVESLNSQMVLIDIHAQRRQRTAALRRLQQALAFHAHTREDFEVRINFRLEPWLKQALLCARQDKLEQIRAYRFSY